MAAPGPQAEGGTVIVPGHGRACDQSEVALYRNMLTIIRNTVQYYKNQGKTLQQVLDLKPSCGIRPALGRPGRIVDDARLRHGGVRDAAGQGTGLLLDENDDDGAVGQGVLI